jgi:hypothetical protein
VQKRYLAAGSVVADDAGLLETDTYVQVIRALIDAIAFGRIDELGKPNPSADVGGGVLVEQDHPERLADAVVAFDLDESPPFEAERHARNEASSDHRGPGEPGVSVDPPGSGTV